LEAQKHGVFFLPPVSFCPSRKLPHLGGCLETFFLFFLIADHLMVELFGTPYCFILLFSVNSYYLVVPVETFKPSRVMNEVAILVVAAFFNFPFSLKVLQFFNVFLIFAAQVPARSFFFPHFPSPPAFFYVRL